MPFPLKSIWSGLACENIFAGVQKQKYFLFVLLNPPPSWILSISTPKESPSCAKGFWGQQRLPLFQDVLPSTSALTAHLVPFTAAFTLAGVKLLDLGGEEVAVNLERGLTQWFVFPQVRGQVLVGLPQGVEDGLDEVTSGTGVPNGSGVAILYTSHVQKFL